MRYTKIARDFLKVVNTLGEDVTFNWSEDKDMPMLETVKASLANATQAAYSMVDRAFLVKGNLVVPKDKGLKDLEGEYFKRESMPSVPYMLLSAIPEPSSPRLCFIYAEECNATISILKKNIGSMEDRDKWGNLVTTYSKDKTDIPVYFYTTLRSYKIQNNGKLDQTIYTAHIPAKYKLSPMDKIVKKNFVDGEYKEVVYNVDSVEPALVTEMGNQELNGVVSMQLTLNLDKVVIK